MTDDPITANLRRAVSFEREGKFFEAESLYRQLVQMRPPHPMSHYAYATYKLLTGDFEGAWPYFQMRLQDPFYRRKGTMQLPQPWWDGNPAPGKTLLVHTDQGIGDAILCARFVPEAADRVGRLIFAVQKGLGRFFNGVDSRIETLETGDPVPEFDIHIDLFSLPALFGAAPGRMPVPPYLAAEPALAAAWRDRLRGPGLAIGLAWRGNPENPRDAEKSIDLAALLPVLRVPRARFFSLQIGAGSDQVRDLPGNVKFADLGPELVPNPHGMIETAAVIDNLDLVISIDTSIAHLDGAMGKRLWVPRCMISDWRWMTAAEIRPPRFGAAPWYPEARPFRQEARWQWAPVVEEIARELAKLAETKASGGKRD